MPVFLPLAAETFGGWHEVAVAQVRKLAVSLAQHNGQEEGEAISHTWLRLGVLLQRKERGHDGHDPHLPCCPD